MSFIISNQDKASQDSLVDASNEPAMTEDLASEVTNELFSKEPEEEVEDEAPSLTVSRLPRIDYNSISQDEIEMLYSNLPIGFGTTIANALRRTILSSTEGYSISGVRINGVDHEFSAIAGVQEDYIQLMINLKSLIISHKEPNLNRVYKIKVEGPAIVTGANFSFNNELEILNKNAYVCSISSGTLELEFCVTKGIGYIQSHEHDEHSPFAKNMILLDVNYSPVLNVRYNVVENLGLENMSLFVKTNGAIDPSEVTRSAVNVLISYLSAIAPDLKREINTEPSDSDHQSKETDFLSIPIDSPRLGLSQRSRNALCAHNIHILGDLASIGESELNNIKNIGKNSVKEIKELLKSYGIVLSN